MAIERMPVTPEIVTWARERAGYKLEESSAKSSFRKIAEWESGSLGPTYRQLEDLAKTLGLPMAVFSFPEPPDLPPIEKTFRTLGSAQFNEIPPSVRLLMHKARAFQLGLAELNGGSNPAQRLIIRDLRLEQNESLQSGAARIREFLGVSLVQQFDWQNEDIALKAWRSALYGVGVAVFKDAQKNSAASAFSTMSFPSSMSTTLTRSRGRYSRYFTNWRIFYIAQAVSTGQETFGMSCLLNRQMLKGIATH